MISFRATTSALKALRTTHPASKRLTGRTLTAPSYVYDKNSTATRPRTASSYQRSITSAWPKATSSIRRSTNNPQHRSSLYPTSASATSTNTPKYLSSRYSEPTNAVFVVGGPERSYFFETDDTQRHPTRLTSLAAWEKLKENARESVNEAYDHVLADTNGDEWVHSVINNTGFTKYLSGSFGPGRRVEGNWFYEQEYADLLAEYCERSEYCNPRRRGIGPSHEIAGSYTANSDSHSQYSRYLINNGPHCT